jgi:hypothetical protein
VASLMGPLSVVRLRARSLPEGFKVEIGHRARPRQTEAKRFSWFRDPKGALYLMGEPGFRSLGDCDEVVAV